jgi:uncharacterized protein
MRTLFPILVALLASGCVQALGGAFTGKPEAAPSALSPAAQALVADAYRDIPPGAARDYHTHVLTLDTETTGGYLNPRMLSWWHPIHRLRTSIYMSAAGVEDLDHADQQYLDRLVSLIRAVPNHGKHYILAFDQHYRADGRVDEAKTEFYVPNDYVWAVCERYPDVFLPAISVHPYRPDALAELDSWGRRGVKLIKWLPNAQGIDASDPRLDPYYAKVREYDMTILTHVGEEQAVEAEEDQRLGNPLLFRRPLDQGVKIIMAHGGSLGSDLDLDNGGTAPSYELVLRLLKEPKYERQLFADISAITQFNRLPAPLLALLQDRSIHGRLVNGSDYPLPAVNVVIHVHKLASNKLIAQEDVAPLREIYRYNPLLFDFVLKRRLRDPATGTGFPASVFVAGAGLAG